jgi:hypothetical protein
MTHHQFTVVQNPTQGVGKMSTEVKIGQEWWPIDPIAKLEVGQIWKIYGVHKTISRIDDNWGLVFWDDGLSTSHSTLEAYGILVTYDDGCNADIPPQVDACAALRDSLPTMTEHASMLIGRVEQLSCLKQRLRASIATRREWPTCPVSGEALVVRTSGTWPGKYDNERRCDITARFTCEHCDVGE